MVTQWPPGVTDYEITQETEAGRLWLEYAEIWRKSHQKRGDFRLATRFYRKNRRIMNKGFKVSWKERYDRATEASAQQHAMNLRLKSPRTFLSEFQNVGKSLVNEGDGHPAKQNLWVALIHDIPPYQTVSSRSISPGVRGTTPARTTASR